MTYPLWVAVLIQCLTGFVASYDSVFLNDDILFHLSTESHYIIEEEKIDVGKLVPIVTSDHEEYKCLLPQLEPKTQNKLESYTGPTPSELVGGIYTDKECLLRIDPYWSYELCHGRYIRQFHEDKDSKKTAEYFLGNYVSNSNEEGQMNQLNPPRRDFHGRKQAYYTVVYQHGTTCDLTGEPRTTTVYYICSLEGMNVFYSLTEVSTCTYEAVIGIAELCAHPMFKLPTPVEHPIRCFASADKKQPEPKALRIFQAEVQRKPLLPTKVGRGAITQKAPQKLIRDEVHQLFQHDKKSTIEEIQKLIEKIAVDKSVKPKVPAAVDPNLLREFWTGRACLYGGTGWWRYEFCYGHSIAQFHEENGMEPAKIFLGYYNLKKQREWASNPSNEAVKRRDDQVYQISQYYSGGDTCEETNMPRSCEVRLACREDFLGTDPNKITMYLIEPKTCSYVLVVESALFCSSLQKADDHGVIPIVVEEEIRFEDQIPMLRVEEIKQIKIVKSVPKAVEDTGPQEQTMSEKKEEKVIPKRGDQKDGHTEL